MRSDPIAGQMYTVQLGNRTADTVDWNMALATEGNNIAWQVVPMDSNTLNLDTDPEFWPKTFKENNGTRRSVKSAESLNDEIMS